MTQWAIDDGSISSASTVRRSLDPANGDVRFHQPSTTIPTLVAGHDRVTRRVDD
jgi:hypothetical protein